MTAFALTGEQQDFAERVRSIASGQLRALAEAGTPGHVNRELRIYEGASEIQRTIIARELYRCAPAGPAPGRLPPGRPRLYDVDATSMLFRDVKVASMSIRRPGRAPGGDRRSREFAERRHQGLRPGLACSP